MGRRRKFNRLHATTLCHSVGTRADLRVLKYTQRLKLERNEGEPFCKCGMHLGRSPHFLAAYTLSRCESLQFGHFSLQVPARTWLHQVHRPFTRGLDLLIVLWVCPRKVLGGILPLSNTEIQCSAFTPSLGSFIVKSDSVQIHHTRPTK